MSESNIPEPMFEGVPAGGHTAAQPSSITRSGGTKSKSALIGAAAGVVVVAGAAVAFAMFGARAGGSDTAAPAVTATVTATPTVTQAVEAPATPEPEPARTVSREEAAKSWSIRATVNGIPGDYSRAGSLNSVTSTPFTEAVGRAYAESGAAGESTTVNAYSRVTNRSYSMACDAQPDTTVLCTGGNDARVLLW